MPNLERFIEAQESDYPIALAEIKAGHKESHWIWYIFPQLDGLGSSYMCKLYGIKDIEEAKEYLSHPILGARLKEITSVLLTLPEKNPSDVMGGWPDDKKLCSCMTLFASISEDDSVFHKVLNEYFNGQVCQRTMEELQVHEKRNQMEIDLSSSNSLFYLRYKRDFSGRDQSFSKQITSQSPEWVGVLEGIHQLNPAEWIKRDGLWLENKIRKDRQTFDSVSCCYLVISRSATINLQMLLLNAFLNGLSVGSTNIDVYTPNNTEQIQIIESLLSK